MFQSPAGTGKLKEAVRVQKTALEEAGDNEEMRKHLRKDMRRWQKELAESD